MTKPILYSFRRCPYAMRARLAIRYNQLSIILREILLKNKPQHMLTLSPKGTVPVLILNTTTMIDESIDIMQWAFKQNKEINESNYYPTSLVQRLIQKNDCYFKYWLDRYKYISRYPELTAFNCRKKCEFFLNILNLILKKQTFLHGNQLGFTDMAIMPFVRQLSSVDREWFFNSHYEDLIHWLNTFLQNELFLSVMQRYQPWRPNDHILYV